MYRQQHPASSKEKTYKQFLQLPVDKKAFAITLMGMLSSMLILIALGTHRIRKKIFAHGLLLLGQPVVRSSCPMPLFLCCISLSSRFFQLRLQRCSLHSLTIELLLRCNEATS